MSRSILMLMAVCVALSACGFRRPLVKPQDIPAYEQKRAEKMRKFDPQPMPAPSMDTNAGTRNPSMQEMMTPMPPVGQ